MPDLDTKFFGHPRGLATLFFTEMWERFSYYGMRALLILFMVAPVANGGLGFDKTNAGAIYGLYTGTVYLACLPGGWIADRIIGAKRAVLLGGILIALGHLCLALPMLNTFYFGLLIIVCGTGLLKTKRQCLGRLTLCPGRHPSRFWFFHFLHGHQHWRHHCSHHLRLCWSTRQLALWVCLGRSWHDGRRGPILVRIKTIPGNETPCRCAKRKPGDVPQVFRLGNIIVHRSRGTAFPRRNRNHGDLHFQHLWSAASRNSNRVLHRPPVFRGLDARRATPPRRYPHSVSCRLHLLVLI